MKGYDMTLSKRVNEKLLTAVRDRGYGSLTRTDPTLLKLIRPSQVEGKKYTYRVDTTNLPKPYTTLTLQYDVENGKNTLTSLNTNTVGGARNKASFMFVLQQAD